MSLSLFGFVSEREPVRPEVVAAEFLSLRGSKNGDARRRIAEIIGGDPRFLWEGEYLRTMDASQLSLADAPFVVFDLETTGASAKEGGVTEFGAVKVYKGEVVEEFSTLVNPEAKISPYVVRLTGITDKMVSGAPKVSEVLPRFEEFVEGSVLVAHNSPFDCSFVTAARGGERLPNPVLDTLKLARILIPGLPRYRLASLVAHLGIRQMPNHRALSDASATAEVLLELLPRLDAAGVRTVGEAVALRGGKKKTKAQKKHLADGIPNTPGVYYFVGKDGTVLYVGKAKCLRARVRTYFNGGDGRRKIGRLVRETAKVEYHETETELHALIHEAREIRRLLPRYNSAGRGDRPGWFIKLDTREAYPVPERVPECEVEDGVVLLGPYRSAGVLDTCIEALGRIFPLRRCSGEVVGPCVYGQMGRCAPCVGMSGEEYESEVVGGISALLRGEGGEEHLSRLVVERSRLAKELEFEAAARLRDLISGIERIRLVRTLESAEGLQAVVAPSTEDGVVEAFILSEGRLVAHRGFAADDEEGLSGFAEEALSGHRGDGVRDGAYEARVVAAYLKRRSGVVEAVGMREAADLVKVARKVSEAVAAAEAGVES